MQLPIEIQALILDNYADVRSYWKKLCSTFVFPLLDVKHRFSTLVIPLLEERLRELEEDRERRLQQAEREFCRANDQEFEQRVLAERDAERVWRSADENTLTSDEIFVLYRNFYQVVSDNSVWKRQGAIRMLGGVL